MGESGGEPMRIGRGTLFKEALLNPGADMKLSGLGIPNEKIYSLLEEVQKKGHVHFGFGDTQDALDYCSHNRVPLMMSGIFTEIINGFEVGDVVCLKSGGRAMVVLRSRHTVVDVKWWSAEGMSEENNVPVECLMALK